MLCMSFDQALCLLSLILKSDAKVEGTSITVTLSHGGFREHPPAKCLISSIFWRFGAPNLRQSVSDFQRCWTFIADVGSETAQGSSAWRAEMLHKTRHYKTQDGWSLQSEHTPSSNRKHYMLPDSISIKLSFFFNRQAKLKSSGLYLNCCFEDCDICCRVKHKQHLIYRFTYLGM